MTGDPATPDEIARLRSLGQWLRSRRSSTHCWRLRLLDGPNMSNLGAGGRDRRNFGAVPSLDVLHASVRSFAEGIGASLEAFQSNHEGALVSDVYASAAKTDAYLVNPAGLSKYGVPFAQALQDSGRPYVELHFANTASLGWTHGAVITRHAAAGVMGFRNHSYIAAVYAVVSALDGGMFADHGR